MAAEHGLQVLPGAEPAPEPAAVPEHHGEQPDLPHDAGLVVELHPELGEIDLSLAPRRRLEPTLERLRLRRPNRSQEIGDDAVAAVVAELPDLAQQPLPGELGIGDQVRGDRRPPSRTSAAAPPARPMERGGRPPLPAPSLAIRRLSRRGQDLARPRTGGQTRPAEHAHPGLPHRRGGEPTASSISRTPSRAERPRQRSGRPRPWRARSDSYGQRALYGRYRRAPTRNTGCRLALLRRGPPRSPREVVAVMPRA